MTSSGAVTGNVLAERGAVDLAPGTAGSLGETVHLREQVVGHGDGCLHTLSITGRATTSGRRGEVELVERGSAPEREGFLEERVAEDVEQGQGDDEVLLDIVVIGPWRDFPEHRDDVAQPAAFAGVPDEVEGDDLGVPTRIRPDRVVRRSTGAAAAVDRTTKSIAARPCRTGRRGRAVTAWTTCAARPEAPWMAAAVSRPT